MSVLGSGVMWMVGWLFCFVLLILATEAWRLKRHRGRGWEMKKQNYEGGAMEMQESAWIVGNISNDGNSCIRSIKNITRKLHPILLPSLFAHTDDTLGNK